MFFFQEVSSKDTEFRPLLFPVDFRYYDVNQNGKITLRELIEVTGRAENVEKAFAASDLNGRLLALGLNSIRAPNMCHFNENYNSVLV